jgi:hypothetical protein
VLAFLLMIAFKFKQNILNPDYSCFWHGLRQAKKNMLASVRYLIFSISDDFSINSLFRGTFNGQTATTFVLTNPPPNRSFRLLC